ncbi:M48 family metalloprotease [Actinomadura napierensis]|uniref:M48 family metalloprotease n=1 Tax=Actinomadura napierensis TaxID=267854 RepID=A0ABP5JMW0_9ACTN
MFDHFVWSVLVIPAAVVVIAALLADRLPPAAGVVALAWSAAVAAVAAFVSLGTFTVKAAGEVPWIAARFGLSQRTIVQDTVHVRWVSWVSVVMLAYAAHAAVRVWRRHRRGREFVREVAELPDLEQVVLIESDEIDALAVPGRPGRIVVTTGMRAVLDDDQFAVLVAHERAHLEADHFRLMLMAELAGAAHPALRWVAHRVSYLIERAADERAVGTVGDRRAVARAIGVAALAANRRPAADSSLRLSFARAVRPGEVPRRVAELLTPRRSRYFTWPAIIPLLLAAGSMVWAMEAVRDLYQLLTLAGSSGP